MADDLHRDEQGAASMIAFMIAGVLFMSVIGVVLLAGDQVTRPVQDENQSAEQVVSANSLADVLMGGSGYYKDDDTGVVKPDWSVDPDLVHRMGLLDLDRQRIDFNKLQNLRLAPFDKSSDGYLNYPEARTSLGMDQAGTDFHIRAFPSLMSVQQLLNCKDADGNPAPHLCRDPNMKVTYVGHLEPTEDAGDDVDVTLPSCTASGDSYYLSTTITNNGAVDTVFSARFHAELAGGAYEVDESVHGFLVPIGESTTLTLPVPAASSIECRANDRVDVEVWGPSSQLKLVPHTLPETIEAPPEPADKYFSVDPDKAYYITGESITVAYGGDLATNDALSLEILQDSTGTSFYGPKSISVPNKQKDWNEEVGALADGEYTMYLTYDPTGDATTVTDHFSVLPADPEAFTTGNLGHAVKVETEFLHVLVEQFCPYTYDDDPRVQTLPTPNTVTWANRCESFKQGQTFEGDVFLDDKHSLNNDLASLLVDDEGEPRYDVVNTLVIGSNVAHNSLTSNSIKGAIETWVLGDDNRGGTLIVFGHDEKNIQWLQPLFHAGIQDMSSGPTATPDPSHPLLHVPNDLDYPSYDDNEQIWKFTAGHDELFTHVIMVGDESDPESILAVNNPGAFQQGNVILTSWLPYDLFKSGQGPSPNPGNAEAMALVQNLLSQGYRDLFLDYGPPLPTQGGSAPSWRISAVCHPQLSVNEDGVCVSPIDMTIQFWVF